MTDETPHHERLQWCKFCHANVEPTIDRTRDFVCPHCGNTLSEVGERR